MTRGTRHGRAAAAAMLPMLLLWMLPVLGGCDTTQRYDAASGRRGRGW